ncbi:MAG: bacteriophage holin [Sedimentisphaerales bacterium]|nr:bacteriophage holin [Sedimentisphaerales bacterium]
MEKLNVKALAIAFGITWSAGMLLSGWAAMCGWCTGMVDVFSTIYIGFAPSILGGIIGAVWGFADGAIGGVIVALIYNIVTKPKTA